MRLAVTFLGLDLFSIDLTTAEADDDYSRDLSGGTLGSDRIGFCPPETSLEDAPLPQRTPPWDD